MVKAERKTHQRRTGTKKKTLALEAIELATEMIDGTHSPTKTDLE